MRVEQLRWSRLYAGATLVGACLGLLVVCGVVPYVPPQLSSWMHSADTEVVCAARGKLAAQSELKRRPVIAD